MKITGIKGEKATVHSRDHDHQVDTSLLETPKIGDWILAHGALAIQKLDKKSAFEMIELQKQVNVA